MDKRSLVNMIVLILAVAILGFMIFYGIRKTSGPASGGDSNVSTSEEKSEENTPELTHADLLDEESLVEDEGEQIIYMPKNEVYSFEMTDSNGIRLNIGKEDGKWVYVDDPNIELNQDRIDKILNYLCDVRSQDFIEDADGEEYGLNQESKSYTLVDATDDTILISIGDKEEKTGRVYFAINYDFSTIYVNSGKLDKVSEYGIEEMIN